MALLLDIPPWLQLRQVNRQCVVEALQCRHALVGPSCPSWGFGGFTCNGAYQVSHVQGSIGVLLRAEGYMQTAEG